MIKILERMRCRKKTWDARRNFHYRPYV